MRHSKLYDLWLTYFAKQHRVIVDTGDCSPCIFSHPDVLKIGTV